MPFTGFQSQFNTDFQPQLKGAGGQFQASQNEPNPYLQGFLKNLTSKAFGPEVAGTLGNIQDAGGLGNFGLKKGMEAMAPKTGSPGVYGGPPGTPTEFGPGGLPSVSSAQGAANAMNTPPGMALSPVAGGAASPELASSIMGSAGASGAAGAAGAGGAAAGLASF